MNREYHSWLSEHHPFLHQPEGVGSLLLWSTWTLRMILNRRCHHPRRQHLDLKNQWMNNHLRNSTAHPFAWSSQWIGQTHQWKWTSGPMPLDLNQHHYQAWRVIHATFLVTRRRTAQVVRQEWIRGFYPWNLTGEQQYQVILASDESLNHHQAGADQRWDQTRYFWH